MIYAVKEIYYTLQGEGAQSGRPAVFCRFAGCNLWSGLEKDRRTAICQFCDTDFVGVDGPNGGKFRTPQALAEAVAEQWPGGGSPMVVCTGGEPLLQIDEALIEAFHAIGFEMAIETNGTLLPPPGIDWICVSPKANAEMVLKSGSELKLVFPQDGSDPAQFEDLAFDHFYLQPMDMQDPVATEKNIKAAMEYCLAHPQWKLSLQTHKVLNIP